MGDRQAGKWPTGAVEDSVAVQCKGSATFNNPVILWRGKGNRVGAAKKAVHNVLKARGKLRESVPGTEWVNTTIPVIQSIIDLITAGYS